MFRQGARPSSYSASAGSYCAYISKSFCAVCNASCSTGVADEISAVWFILTERNPKRRLACRAFYYTLPNALLVVSMRSQLMCADTGDACLNLTHANVPLLASRWSLYAASGTNYAQTNCARQTLRTVRHCFDAQCQPRWPTRQQTISHEPAAHAIYADEECRKRYFDVT